MNAPVTAVTQQDDLDRRIVLATQAGLPLVPRPYAAVAEQVGASEAEVRRRLAAMLESGRIRRIGAGAPGRLDEALGQFAERALVEQVGRRGRLRKRRSGGW